jgi:hypothetical protein
MLGADGSERARGSSSSSGGRSVSARACARTRAGCWELMAPSALGAGAISKPEENSCSQSLDSYVAATMVVAGKNAEEDGHG